MTATSRTGLSGWVFNIQYYSIHDGPGIRTSVFLMGCSLQCIWCSNPESLRCIPHLLHHSERCIDCGICKAICPRDAIKEEQASGKWVLVERCSLCGKCVEACCTGAWQQVGQIMSAAEVLDLIWADHLFYQASGGGVTLSGGDPMCQPGFSRALLQHCQERGIHTAIETSGYAPWKSWGLVLPFLDLILFDVKELDPVRHQRYTGRSNDLILDNLRKLAKSGTPIILRRPVIPGYNDSAEDIKALAELARRLETIQEIHLLPYHRFGMNKYRQLGLDYVLGNQPSLSRADVSHLRDILIDSGFLVKVGG